MIIPNKTHRNMLVRYIDKSLKQLSPITKLLARKNMCTGIKDGMENRQGKSSHKQLEIITHSSSLPICNKSGFYEFVQIKNKTTNTLINDYKFIIVKHIKPFRRKIRHRA